MFHTFFGWLKGLSLVGKAALGVATIGTASALADQASPPPQQTVNHSQQTVQQTTRTPVVTTKTETVEQTIPFDTRTEQDSKMQKGITAVKITGVNGIKTLTYKITLTDGIQTGKELVGEEIIKQPTTEVTAIGSYVAPQLVAAPLPAPSTNASDCDPNYTGGCVPNVSYDLDCRDIGFSVRVIGTDKHRFDREGDGIGCEAYR